VLCALCSLDHALRLQSIVGEGEVHGSIVVCPRGRGGVQRRTLSVWGDAVGSCQPLAPVASLGDRNGARLTPAGASTCCSGDWRRRRTVGNEGAKDIGTWERQEGAGKSKVRVLKHSAPLMAAQLSIGWRMTQEPPASSIDDRGGVCVCLGGGGGGGGEGGDTETEKH
jgi:hypothetical protein